MHNTQTAMPDPIRYRPDAVVRYALAGGVHVGPVFDVTYTDPYIPARETWRRYLDRDAFPMWGDGCEPWRFGDMLPVVVAVYVNAADAATCAAGILYHNDDDTPRPTVADVCGAYTVADLPAVADAWRSAVYDRHGEAATFAATVRYYLSEIVDRATRDGGCRCRHLHTPSDVCAVAV